MDRREARTKAKTMIIRQQLGGGSNYKTLREEQEGNLQLQEEEAGIYAPVGFLHKGLSLGSCGCATPLQNLPDAAGGNQRIPYKTRTKEQNQSETTTIIRRH